MQDQITQLQNEITQLQQRLEELTSVVNRYNFSSTQVFVKKTDFSQFKAGYPSMRFIPDANDPTAGGGAAVGRIAIDINGTTKYLAYY